MKVGSEQDTLGKASQELREGCETTGESGERYDLIWLAIINSHFDGHAKKRLLDNKPFGLLVKKQKEKF